MRESSRLSKLQKPSDHSAMSVRNGHIANVKTDETQYTEKKSGGENNPRSDDGKYTRPIRSWQLGHHGRALAERLVIEGAQRNTALIRLKYFRLTI